MNSPRRRTLSATLRGRMVPDSDERAYGPARIFKHGILLVRWPNRVLYLTTKPGYGPFNVYVPDLWSAGNAFTDNQHATIEDRRVVFRDARLTVDLALAAVAPRPDCVSGLSRREIARHAHAIIAQIMPCAAGRSVALTALADLLGYPCRAMDDDPLAEALHSAMRGLFAASAAGDPAMICRAGRRLLGLGQGLTPSGDDVLAGYLAALRIIGPCLAVPIKYRANLHTAILAESEMYTHTISRALLEAASQGEVSGALLEAIGNIGRGAPLTPSQVADLLQTGHSSGLDGLSGVLLFVVAHSPTQLKKKA